MGLFFAFSRGEVWVYFYISGIESIKKKSPV